MGSLGLNTHYTISPALFNLRSNNSNKGRESIYALASLAGISGINKDDFGYFL